MTEASLPSGPKRSTAPRTGLRLAVDKARREVSGSAPTSVDPFDEGAKFAVLGPRRRTVNNGDVFAWQLSGRTHKYVGQVLDTDIDFVGAKLLPVAFFDVPADAIQSDRIPFGPERMFCEPLITNRTGWLDGFFVTITNLPPADLGRVGFAKVTGEVVDLRGEPDDRNRFDVVALYALSPPGSIAPMLARPTLT